MDKTERRRRVRLAVKGEMNRRSWNSQQLIDEAALDRSTVRDFLDGDRWPQRRTLAAVERALGWAPGSIDDVLEGGNPPTLMLVLNGNAERQAVVGDDSEDAEYDTDEAGDYVAAPGETVHGGTPDADLLDTLRGLREAVDRLNERLDQQAGQQHTD